MTKRKTFSVEALKTECNRLLALPNNDRINKDYRNAIADLLEHILHETGNYNGFNYNHWLETGFKEWEAAGKPDFPEKNRFFGDETHRTYY